MRILYVSLGFTTLAIGAVGVVLPVLPTTPFLLLTAYFFGKGSKRFSDWFQSKTLYKNHLEEFIKTKSMTRKKKWTLLIFVDIIMVISFLSVNSIYLKVLIVVLVLIKYYYFQTHIKIKEKSH
ncbi:MAG: YbaN family protein [Candidatus Izimaplasma sp.]|nr:YbaN family protein [Candidatus Izimaplasma bacterium]